MMITTSLSCLRSVAPLERRLFTRWWAPSITAARTPRTSQTTFVQQQTMHTLSTTRLNTQLHTSLTTPNTTITSSTTTINTRRQKTQMVPRKAALALTPKARTLFQKLISATNSQGIMLKYEISSQHALRMAFKFDLIKDVKTELSDQDEG